MSLLSPYIAIFLIHLLAVASPGPGFLVVTQNAIRFGIKAGIATAFGIALGDLVLLIAAVAGTAALLIVYPKAMTFIQILGAAYLIYIGIKSLKSFLFSKNSKEETEASLSTSSGVKEIPLFEACSRGFITTILNPKAIIYFLSLTSQIVKPEEGMFRNVLVVSVLIMITFFWFSFVAAIIGNYKIRHQLQQKQNLVDGVLGILLISLGLFIISSLFELKSLYKVFL